MNDFTPEEITAIKSLAAAMRGNKSGGWVVEESTMVFANPSHPSGLWSIAGPTPKTYIDAPSDKLRGYIRKLWYKKNEAGALNWYLKVEALTGEFYIIQSAHNRVFSRGMLAALSMSEEEDLRKEVTIQCRAWTGDKGKSQFFVLYLSGKGEVETPVVDEAALPAVAIAAQTMVALANGYEYTPPE